MAELAAIIVGFIIVGCFLESCHEKH